MLPVRLSSLFLACLLLGACGTRTALTLPPRPAPAGAAQPAQPSQPPADDNKASSGSVR